jgi:hypothetical protein
MSRKPNLKAILLMRSVAERSVIEEGVCYPAASLLFFAKD